MKSSSEIVYQKGSEIAYVGDTFIYESSVFLYYKNYAFLTNSSTYESKEPIPISETTFISKNVEIRNEIYQAPLNWLLDNGFREWKPRVKPKRKVKNGK